MPVAPGSRESEVGRSREQFQASLGNVFVTLPQTNKNKQ